MALYRASTIGQQTQYLFYLTHPLFSARTVNGFLFLSVILIRWLLNQGEKDNTQVSSSLHSWECYKLILKTMLVVNCWFYLTSGLKRIDYNVPVQSFWFGVKVQGSPLNRGLLGTESWSTWICPTLTHLWKEKQNEKTNHQLRKTVICPLHATTTNICVECWHSHRSWHEFMFHSAKTWHLQKKWMLTVKSQQTPNRQGVVSCDCVGGCSSLFGCCVPSFRLVEMTTGTGWLGW